MPIVAVLAVLSFIAAAAVVVTLLLLLLLLLLITIIVIRVRAPIAMIVSHSITIYDYCYHLL